MKAQDKSTHKKGSSAKRPQQADPAASTQIEARFQAVFESSRDAIGVSKAGIHVFVNPAYLALFGFSPETELAGKPILDLIAPGSRDQIKAHIRHRLRGEPAPAAYETRGLRIDGSEFDMEVNVSLYQEGGEEHTLVILRDVTGRKRAEREIAEHGALVQQIMDTASVAIFLVDKSGRIVHANRRMAEMFGCTMEELLGSEYVDHVHPSERAVGRRKMLALLASEIDAVDLERLYWRQNGSEFWGHLAGRRFHDVQGNELGLIGVITDIDLRKQSEMALKQSEEKLRRLYNETPTLLHSVDRNGIVVEVNDFWLRTLGYQREEVIGRKVTDFYTDASRKYAEEVVLPAFFQNGVAKDIAYQFVRKNGELVDVLLSATAELDAAGNPVRSQAVIVDITERKRAEDLLRRSEARYRMLYQGTPVMMHSIDPEGKLVSVSDQWLKQLGYTRDEVLGQHSVDFLDEESRVLAQTVVLPYFMRTGVCNDVPYTFVKKNGERLLTLLSAIAERDEAGALVRSLAVIVDVTARKRAERELRESEERLRRLVEHSPLAITIIDSAGRIEYTNSKHAEIVGYTTAEVPTLEAWWALVYPDAKARERVKTDWRDLSRRLFNGEEVEPVERSIVCKDGSRKDMEMRFSLTGDKILSIFIDVSERKRAEEALRENRARLDLALQSAHMGVWRWEIRENRRYFDERVCQLLGISAATFGGTVAEFLQAVHPEDREQVRTALARTVEQDAPYEPTYRVVWPDGSVHHLAARGRLVRDDTGQPARVNGILWDVTDQRLLEEERIKTQKLESVGMLAGGIAHDFNNLLQGVFGFISMARMTHDQKEKSLAMLAEAEKALHQSVKLTSQLLTFSKGGKPVKKVVDLRLLIENAVTLALSGSRNTAEIDIDEDLCAAEVDEGQIGQVVQNIMLNADQAMPLGGVIRVAAHNMPATSLVPPADLQGDLVEITIRDQGAGIPAEHLTRIFDPYFTTKEKGSGLGLATSYSIISNHGGLLRVQSEIGKGTTLFVYLPASGAQPEKTRQRQIPAATRRGRILVMDDEEMIRALADEMLASLGHEVAVAADGENALVAYRTARDAGRPFDAVILDLTIRGGMGGIETLRKLVEIDPDIKAVVSSGYSEDAALANYREQGFQAVLDKPYSMSDLQDVLNSLFS